MEAFNWQSILRFLVVAFPLAYALHSARRISRDDYIFNSAKTGLVTTVAGIVCGNIGIGTFVAIGLFSQASPVIGLSLALAYTLGLVICALAAPFLQRLSRGHGVYGLVDLIAARHGIRNPLAIWLPFAFVFLLRAAVQLLALAAILGSLLEIPPIPAIAIAGLIAGVYTAIGGYRVAVRTDIFQALFILGGIGVLAHANWQETPDIDAFWSLGPYEWPLLVGVWLFIPLSAVLAVDNWQRVTTAESQATARVGFLIGAAICLLCYLTIVWLGLGGHMSNDIKAALENAAPAGLGWLVSAMLIAVIMSSVDTLVMPLMSSLDRSRLGLGGLRLVVFFVFLLLTILAMTLGPFLNSVITAFSALVAFLPAVFVTLFLRGGQPVAIVLSLNLGIVATISWLNIDLNTAAFAGLVAAFLPIGASCALRAIKQMAGPDRGTLFVQRDKARE